MTTQYSLVDWYDLPETAQAKLSDHSTLYSGDSIELWKTIGGDLQFVVSDIGSETLPLFVKRVGPVSHAQLFVQGLPISMPREKECQEACLQTLRNNFYRITLVDFDNRITSIPDQWARNSTATELLTISPEFEPVDSNLRSEIRKSIREGLHIDAVSTVEDIRDALMLFAEHGKQNTHRFPPTFLGKLVELAVANSDICWLLARRDGVAVASQIFVRVGDTLLYWLSVLDRRAVATKPAVALFAEGIRRGALHGATTCNLGWSPPSEKGLLEFKRRWGSRPHEYSIYSHALWWWPK